MFDFIINVGVAEVEIAHQVIDAGEDALEALFVVTIGHANTLLHPEMEPAGIVGREADTDVEHAGLHIVRFYDIEVLDEIGETPCELVGVIRGHGTPPKPGIR